MAEKPILFSGPMVRAILDGRKTQTRRVVKHDPFFGKPDRGNAFVDGGPQSPYLHNPQDGGEYGDETVQRVYPAYQVGDTLWVRETWAEFDKPPKVEYRADCDHYEYGLATIRRDDLAVPRVIDRWRPSIFMPRWASRIALEVTDVRCQRLQEISEEDAVAEGCSGHDGEGPYISAFGGRRIINNFAALWDTLNAKRGYGWDSNPWVWAYTFKVLEVRR